MRDRDPLHLFPRVLRKVLAPFAIATVTGTSLVAPALAGGQLLWTSPSGNEGWSGKVVSIGAEGTQVFTKVGPFQDYVRIFSANDENPPAPIFQDYSTDTTFHYSVDSAESTDVHVAMYDVYADATLQTRRPYLKKYSLNAPWGNWTYIFQTLTNGHDSLAVRISRDGSRIVAVLHDNATNKEQVKVFSPASSIPIKEFTVDVGSPFRAIDLSADGSKLYVAGGIRLAVADVASGALLHSAIVFTPLYNAHAISGDGTYFAYGSSGKVVVYKRVASTGVYALHYTHTLPGVNFCDRLDISDDNSTLACGFNFTDSYLSVTVQALDLASGALQMTDTVTGQGLHQNIVSDVAISRDGSRFAIGLWGDQGGQAQEVRAYSRHQNAPLAVFDLPGSAFDVDLSADGERIAVASKALHANVSGGGGRIDLYQVDAKDVRVVGVPHSGAHVEVEFDGVPGAPARLLWAPALAPVPISFGSTGTLFLDRPTVSSMAVGWVGGDGVARTNFPLVSALVGTKLYFQGSTSAPRRLTADWAGVTIIP